jgi:hypothetical protein
MIYSELTDEQLSARKLLLKMELNSVYFTNINSNPNSFDGILNDVQDVKREIQRRKSV